jgi:hypothetical protein
MHRTRVPKPGTGSQLKVFDYKQNLVQYGPDRWEFDHDSNTLSKNITQEALVDQKNCIKK